MTDNLNIVRHFLYQAGLSPEFIAIEDRDQSYSYKQLDQLVRNYTAYYDDLGLYKGTKVIVLHPPCVELFAAILALLSKGCAVVFVEEWSKISDITAACQTIQCDYIITGWKGKCIRLFNKTLRKLSLLNIHSVPKTENQSLSPVLMDDSSPAIISFSSGSSGASKAVVRTHGTLNAQFNALKNHIKLADTNRMCTNFPVVILLNLGLGICTVLSENIVMSNLKKSKIGDLYNELLSKSVTHLAISPFLMINLAIYSLNQSLKQLKFNQILSGGSPIYPKYAEMLVAAFDCNHIDILYGSSEAEPIAACNAQSIVDNRGGRGLFAGKVDAATQCIIGRVVDSKFQMSDVNSIGEILVSGDHVVKLYLNSDLAFQKNKISLDGVLWHRTGDYGYYDHNGSLFLTGQPIQTLNNQVLFDIEKSLVEIDGIDLGTILGNKAYIQLSNHRYKSSVSQKLMELYPELNAIQFLQLPLDRRHNGKIKYHLLK